MKIVELTELEIASIRDLLMALDQRLYTLERQLAIAKEKPREPKPQFYEQPIEGAEYCSE
jgi:hypothetical protein